MKSKWKMEGKFRLEQVRDGKVIAVREGKNIIVSEGFEALLNIMFYSTSKISNWYIGLVGDSPTYAVGDTLASHTGWTEDANYAGNRKAWVTGASASGSISNSSASEFTMNATTTIAGAFICSAETGTTGTLWCEKSFAADLAVVDTDVIRIYYTTTVSQA